jgi:hypothetical protein
MSFPFVAQNSFNLHQNIRRARAIANNNGSLRSGHRDLDCDRAVEACSIKSSGRDNLINDRGLYCRR